MARHHIIALVSLTVALALTAARCTFAQGGEGGLAVDKVAYQGWKNNVRLSNGAVELIVTLDVGPRIISYRLADGKNVFKEYAAQLGKTGEKSWQIRGGHRLWVGPEDLTRTYAADNGPVAYKEMGGMVRFTPAPETEHGIQKEIDVRLSAAGSKVTVIHRITNSGDKPTELTPWALSVMAAGGVEIIPFPAKKPHPGSAKNATSPRDFAPNQLVAIWPFTDLQDGRWHLGSRYITLRQHANKGAAKLGLAHKVGWVGYLNDGTLFVKRFTYEEGKTYPDNGCNFETFTNEDMLEVETVGPLVRLAPGKSVELEETWELFGNVGNVKDEADIDRNVLPKVTPK